MNSCKKTIVETIVNMLDGISNKEWKVIKAAVDMQYEALANKNTLTGNKDTIFNNIMDEII